MWFPFLCFRFQVAALIIDEDDQSDFNNPFKGEPLTRSLTNIFVNTPTPKVTVPAVSTNLLEQSAHSSRNVYQEKWILQCENKTLTPTQTLGGLGLPLQTLLSSTINCRLPSPPCSRTVYQDQDSRRSTTMSRQASTLCLPPVQPKTPELGLSSSHRSVKCPKCHS